MGAGGERALSAEYRSALLSRATDDSNIALRFATLRDAYNAMETAVLADRLALIAAFRETRSCGVELARIRAALATEDGPRHPVPVGAPNLE